MKYLKLLFFVFLFGFTSFAQSQKSLVNNNELTIPINTELKLNIKENNGIFSNFTIVNESKIENPMDMMSVLQNTERKEINSDDIDFKFSEADFMGSKIYILTTVQHFKNPIIFKAKIRLKGSNNYIETSIVPKIPNVFSVEQWNDPLDSIILSDFKFTNK